MAPSLPRTKTSRRKLELIQEMAAGDEVHTPPRESQVPLPLVCQRAPSVSTAKKLVLRYPVGDVEASEELNAGPVPASTVPLTPVALLTAAKSETSIRVAKTMLIVVRL
jgi:hypothetical protein